MKIESKDDLIDFIACVILATVVVGAFAAFMLFILSRVVV